MKTQDPAEGILKRNDWGDSKLYQVVCNCGESSHDHNVWVEADITGITVQIFTEQTSDHWTNEIEPRYDIENTIFQNIYWFWVGLLNDWARRFKLTWNILTTGYIKYEATIYMSKQQALNYADTLKNAVKDVEGFQKNRQSNTERATITKMANEQDCV